MSAFMVYMAAINLALAFELPHARWIFLVGFAASLQAAIAWRVK